MILTFNKISAVVEIPVHAMYHQTKYAGLGVIVLTEEKQTEIQTQNLARGMVLKTILSSLLQTVII